jgi:hypothetical protein
VELRQYNQQKDLLPDISNDRTSPPPPATLLCCRFGCGANGCRGLRGSMVRGFKSSRVCVLGLVEDRVGVGIDALAVL